MPTDTSTDRGQRGAAVLDQALPGWEGRVSLSRLDMASGCDCVLGQLFGDFQLGARLLGVDRRHPDRPWVPSSRTEELGFFVRPRTINKWIVHSDLMYDMEVGHQMREYKALTLAWAELITNRRTEKMLAEIQTVELELVPA